MSRHILEIAADLWALSPPEKLRVAATLFESGSPLHERMADSLVRRALEEESLARSRRDLAVERQSRQQAGEPAR